VIGLKSGGDLGDLQFGKLATVTDGAVVALAALEFESDDLVVLVLLDDLGLHRSSGNERGAEVDFVAVDDEEDIAKGGLFAGLEVKLLNAQDVAFGNAVLLAAGLDDCVGHGKFVEKGWLGCHGPHRPSIKFFDFSLLLRPGSSV
jgi:hypothetical protein